MYYVQIQPPQKGVICVIYLSDVPEYGDFVEWGCANRHKYHTHCVDNMNMEWILRHHLDECDLEYWYNLQCSLCWETTCCQQFLDFKRYGPKSPANTAIPQNDPDHPQYVSAGSRPTETPHEHDEVRVAHNRAQRIERFFNHLDASHQALKISAVETLDNAPSSVIFTRNALGKRAEINKMLHLRRIYKPRASTNHTFDYTIVAHVDDSVNGIGRAWIAILYDSDFSPIILSPFFKHNDEVMTWTSTTKSYRLYDGPKLCTGYDWKVHERTPRTSVSG
jgi:hypothetical protein